MFSSRTDLAALDRRLRRVEGLLELIATKLEISARDVEDAARERVSAEVAELVAAGKKIMAIKVLREQQDLDLVSAKRIVDEISG